MHTSSYRAEIDDYKEKKNKVGKSRIRKEVQISIPILFFANAKTRQKEAEETKFIVNNVWKKCLWWPLFSSNPYLRCPTGSSQPSTILEAKGKSFGYFGQCVKSHKSFFVLLYNVLFLRQMIDIYRCSAVSLKNAPMVAFTMTLLLENRFISQAPF